VFAAFLCASIRFYVIFAKNAPERKQIFSDIERRALVFIEKSQISALNFSNRFPFKHLMKRRKVDIILYKESFKKRIQFIAVQRKGNLYEKIFIRSSCGAPDL
jgi:hypothetical protein